MDDWQEFNDRLDGVVLEIVEAAKDHTLTKSLLAAWAGHAMSVPVWTNQITHTLRRLTDSGVITKRIGKYSRFYLDKVTT